MSFPREGQASLWVRDEKVSIITHARMFVVLVRRFSSFVRARWKSRICTSSGRVTSGLADAQQAFQHFAQEPSSSNRMLLVLTSTVKVLYPEFQVSDMLKDSVLPAYQHVAETCGGEAEPEFTNGMLKVAWANNRFVKEFFSGNTPGQKPAHGPLLVISGEADPVIPGEMSQKR